MGKVGFHVKVGRGWPNDAGPIHDEITRRLVDYLHAERAHLFGSAARGDEGPDSDLESALCWRTMGPDERFYYNPGARQAQRGIGTAADDPVRWPASDFDARGAHVLASLPATILRERKLLYDARRAAGDEAARWLSPAAKDLKQARLLADEEPAGSSTVYCCPRYWRFRR